MAERIPYERYNLTLRHEFVDDRGTNFNLDEPLVIEYIMLCGEEHRVPTPLLLNEMMDKMKAGLLELVKKKGQI